MTIEEIIQAKKDGHKVVTPEDALGYWEVCKIVESWPYVWYHYGKCAMTNGTFFDITSNEAECLNNQCFIIRK